MTLHNNIVKLSLATSDTIGKLQDLPGRSDKNSGLVKVYNNYRPLLRELDEDERLIQQLLISVRREIQDFMIEYSEEVYYELDSYLQAYREFYDLPDLNVPAVSRNNFVAGLMTTYDAQANYIVSSIRSGAENSSVFGEGSIAAAFTVGFLLRFLADRVTDLFSSSLLDTTAFKSDTYVKQAIATLNRRTTQCCIRVHGQIVPYSGKFTTTGTPHFATKQSWTPFHNWCRTTIAVVHKEDIDDEVTARLLKNKAGFI